MCKVCLNEKHLVYKLPLMWKTQFLIPLLLVLPLHFLLVKYWTRSIFHSHGTSFRIWLIYSFNYWHWYDIKHSCKIFKNSKANWILWSVWKIIKKQEESLYLEQSFCFLNENNVYMTSWGVINVFSSPEGGKRHYK